MQRAEISAEPKTVEFNTEDEIFRVQHFWINRINSFYMHVLGVLSGMSVLHLIVLLGVSDEKLLDIYSPFAKNINLVFLVFANIALILCFAMTLIYKQRLDEKLRAMDEIADKFKHYYRISAVATFLQFCSWCLLFYLPNYTNQLHYRLSNQITPEAVNNLKVLYIIVNVLFFITWCLSSSIAHAAEDSTLEPEYDDYNTVNEDDRELIQT